MVSHGPLSKKAIKKNKHSRLSLTVKAFPFLQPFPEGDEPPMAACGGNLIDGEISRNEQCPHEADLLLFRPRTWGNRSLGIKERFPQKYLCSGTENVRLCVTVLRSRAAAWYNDQGKSAARREKG